MKMNINDKPTGAEMGTSHPRGAEALLPRGFGAEGAVGSKCWNKEYEL